MKADGTFYIAKKGMLTACGAYPSWRIVACNPGSRTFHIGDIVSVTKKSTKDHPGSFKQYFVVGDVGPEVGEKTLDFYLGSNRSLYESMRKKGRIEIEVRVAGHVSRKEIRQNQHKLLSFIHEWLKHRAHKSPH